MEMASMSLFRHSGHFWSFGAFVGHFWPILAPNSKLSQVNSHVTTQNDRKRSRIPMEMGQMMTFRSFRAILCSIGAIFSLEIHSILKTLSMFVSDIDIFQKETKCTFMKTSFKLIVWLFLRLLRNCLRKYCLWFVFDRELENISRSEVFPCGRPLVRLVIEHLAFEDIHGWYCCTFDEFSTHDGVDINMCMFSKMYDTNMNFWR